MTATAVSTKQVRRASDTLVAHTRRVYMIKFSMLTVTTVSITGRQLKTGPPVKAVTMRSTTLKFGMTTTQILGRLKNYRTRRHSIGLLLLVGPKKPALKPWLTSSTATVFVSIGSDSRTT